MRREQEERWRRAARRRIRETLALRRATGRALRPPAPPGQVADGRRAA